METPAVLDLRRHGHFGTDVNGLPDNIHEASVGVCEVLDHLDYSEAMVRHRRDIYTDIGTIVGIHSPACTVTISGSKGEGFSAPYENDMDIMHTHNYIMCTLSGDASQTLPDTHTVFTLDGDDCHAGYYNLELRHIGRVQNIAIEAALFKHSNERIYLSSHKYTNFMFKSSTTLKLSGPALTDFRKCMSYDSVYAIPCTNQEQLFSEWINRQRLHNWPPPELIKEIKTLPAYLVPVGCKSSENKHMEWRVGFTGEKKLIESFNESQYKLYITLKLINKSVLKPICKDFSYIIKNVVLWLFESNSQNSFSRDYLIVDAIFCFEKLKEAIRYNHLSYYMIPSRNLLTGKVGHNEQKLLIAKLDELIQEGPRVVYRCPKIADALQMSPAELEEKGRWKDKLEKLWLENRRTQFTYWTLGMETKHAIQLLRRDPHFISVIRSIQDMVWPLWRLYEGEDICDILDMKMAQALS